MKEISLEAYAWRAGEDSNSYILQLTAMPTMLRQASEEVGGTRVGQGYNPLTKKSIVLLEKSFKSRGEWLDFARSLTFRLVELSDKTEKERIFNERKR